MSFGVLMKQGQLVKVEMRKKNKKRLLVCSMASFKLPKAPVSLYCLVTINIILNIFYKFCESIYFPPSKFEELEN